ncbi:single-stranded DNA-binding protein [Mesoplasma syrphidae]|uniref:Single-stranded DNA-binding protein n=1 Tax=Mesoplasma syrphidae TaxID=225999 RepID=A0A2K9CE23_9MOLU|nr:single-stranded DNA-binding protein [Mesoplasma syrphidae]AUF83894.1 single-stranded DNA-binding protein [Mesoplasma syrphidae]
MNQVSLIGRLARDPELREAGNGSKFLGFTLAVSEFSRDKEFTNFIPCVAWDKAAENMAKFLKKGSLIAVTGRISVRSNNTNGKYETIVNVNADRVQFLESKSNNASTASNQSSQSDSNFDLSQNNGFVQEQEPVGNLSNEDEIILSDDDSILWD